MSRTPPISTLPRVNAGCGAAALGLFGAIFLLFGFGAGLTMYPSVGPMSLLFSLPFTLCGAALLVGAVTTYRQGRADPLRVPSSMTAGVAAARAGTSATASTAGTFGRPAAGRFGGQVSAESGPLVLRAGAARLGRLAVMLFICLFWNGLVGVATWAVYLGPEHHPIVVRLFLIPFQLIGLLVLWGVVHHALALLNPRPTLTLANRQTRLGESLTVQWELSGAVSRLGALRITLIGKEEATFRRGTDTTRDSHVFHRALVAEAREAGRITRGMAAVTIPAGSMHSFSASNNKIVWALEVSGEITWWPDLDETFEITVTP